MISEDRSEMSLTDKINAAFKLVAMEVVAAAKQSNTDIVLWRNGNVVHLSPEDVLLEKASGSGE